MNEMIYTGTRLNLPEVLYSEEYKGYKFYILNLGTHPCAYVEIPKGNKFYEVEYDNIDIDCHCGLTYSNKSLRSVDESGWFIGWDYAHLGDYVGYFEYNYGEDKKWTTLEIYEECKNVIEQLVELNK
jgi:hypothetical protein